RRAEAVGPGARRPAAGYHRGRSVRPSITRSGVTPAALRRARPATGSGCRRCREPDLDLERVAALGPLDLAADPADRTQIVLDRADPPHRLGRPADPGVLDLGLHRDLGRGLGTADLDQCRDR